LASAVHQFWRLEPADEHDRGGRLTELIPPRRVPIASCRTGIFCTTFGTGVRAMIACGGTGGHLFPGLAVAEALKARRHEVRFVDHVAVGLGECARFFGRKPVTVTGTPIRATLRRGKIADATDKLGLKRGRLTVLVMGGSQGAHALNETVANALPRLTEWKNK